MTLAHKRIVVIGGGTGILPVLHGLKNETSELSVIVTMADDGGSTGILREEFGILPPGDIRRALVALAQSDESLLAKLMAYRFTEGAGLTGHAFGNLMLTALERITGSFEGAVREAERLLGVRGTVIPVTLTPTRLVAELEDGTFIHGETNMDIPQHDGRLAITRVWLEPPAPINPRAASAIANADAIIVGPGDLFTSLVPNLVVGGMREALMTSKATLLYFVNLLTKFGETNHFTAEDFVRTVEFSIAKDRIDYALVNTTRPSPARMKPYVREKAEFVSPEMTPRGSKPLVIYADLLRPKGFIRHDAEKIKNVLNSLL